LDSYESRKWCVIENPDGRKSVILGAIRPFGGKTSAPGKKRLIVRRKNSVRGEERGHGLNREGGET